MRTVTTGPVPGNNTVTEAKPATGTSDRSTPATSAPSIARGLMATKSSNWMVMLSGFFEPVLYLISMGVGLGAIVGSVQGPGGGEISYAAYIAPALLAVSAMNGAVYDSTWNVFFKMNFAKLYQGMLYTSLGPLDVAMGEIFLALLRGLMYATGFTAVMGLMGLITTPWATSDDPGRGADRLRLRELRHGDHQLHEDVPADGLDQLRDAADVPVQRHLLPAERLPASPSSGSSRPCRCGTVWSCCGRSAWASFTPATAVHIGYYLVMIVLGVHAHHRPAAQACSSSSPLRATWAGCPFAPGGSGPGRPGGLR
jgi:lipooligosaccharide transport system permease protein